MKGNKQIKSPSSSFFERISIKIWYAVSVYHLDVYQGSAEEKKLNQCSSVQLCVAKHAALFSSAVLSNAVFFCVS